MIINPHGAAHNHERVKVIQRWERVSGEEASAADFNLSALCPRLDLSETFKCDVLEVVQLHVGPLFPAQNQGLRIVQRMNEKQRI